MAFNTIPTEVEEVFKRYPAPLRKKLLELRELILETAAETAEVGEIEEALRWGEPSYLTTQSKSGSTIRIGPFKRSDEHYAMYVNCKTSLISTYHRLYPDLFTYQGDRAIVFDLHEALSRHELSHCIAMALRYHKDKRLKHH